MGRTGDGMEGNKGNHRGLPLPDVTSNGTHQRRTDDRPALVFWLRGFLGRLSQKEGLVRWMGLEGPLGRCVALGEFDGIGPRGDIDLNVHLLSRR
jgi:hypothetical protein